MGIYDKLFGKNADQVEFMLDVARVLVRGGKYKEAEEMLKKAVQMAPSDAKPHMFMGGLYERMKKDGDAQKEYEKAVRLEPDQADYHNQLATVLFRRKHIEDAEKELMRALDLDEDCAEAHANLGALFLQAQKYTEAESHLQRAIQLNPTDGHPHRNLGLLLCKTGRMEQGLPELESAVSIYSKEGQTELAKQLEPVLQQARAKARQREEARERKASLPPRQHEIGDWTMDHGEATGVLNQLYEAYTSRSTPPQKKMKDLQAIVNKNRPIIYGKPEFTEVLESEIEKTTRDGPAVMAMQYLEIRWLITGRPDHRKEMVEFEEKVKGMSFEELLGL